MDLRTFDSQKKLRAIKNQNQKLISRVTFFISFFIFHTGNELLMITPCNRERMQNFVTTLIGVVVINISL